MSTSLMDHSDPVGWARTECIAKWPRQLLMLCALLLVIWACTPWVMPQKSTGTIGLVTLGAIGIWRWGWGACHYLRAVLYRYWVYPRLRRKAYRAVREKGPVPELVILATTYKEEEDITRGVVHSLIREFSLLEGIERKPRLIFVTGSDEDDATVRREFNAAVDNYESVEQSCWPPELILLRGENGKRNAIAQGLRFVADQGMHPDGALILMDGDSVPEYGAINKMLPFFRLDSRIGALTSNEQAVLKAPRWFTEWIKLRFGQRHLYMCSVALSRKLLCLTGRMSMFRGSVATNPDFINQIENDRLEHWLFGEYQMFSGDDKSSWYWLVSHGYDLVYVPDAMVITYEVIKGRGYDRAIANMKRWSGNMLRNSGRAIAIGPHRLRLFPWLCTVDQKVSMWTALIGPVASVCALCCSEYRFVAIYMLWVLFTRTVRVMAAWKHGQRISFWYIPLQFLSEWVGSLVKIWVYFHPVKQTWMNRGNRTLDSTKQARFRRTRLAVASYSYSLCCFLFVLAVGTYIGLFPIIRELPLVLRNPANTSTIEINSQKTASLVADASRGFPFP